MRRGSLSMCGCWSRRIAVYFLLCNVGLFLPSRFSFLAAQEKTADSPSARAQPGRRGALRALLQGGETAGGAKRQWQVDGTTREAILFIPATARRTAAGSEKPAATADAAPTSTMPSPIIFAFHGHGGTMAHAARSFGYQRLWPEAIVVYMQGLNTPGRLTDPEGKKPGWQHDVGEQGDRDLKFFDAVLDSLKKEYAVDTRRIYATGHSNGGSFTYLLWSQRGAAFAAVAPSAAVPPRLARNDLKPKPVLHVAGENDPLVKYEWQKMTMEMLRKLNQCDAAGQAWGEHLTQYKAADHPPVVTFITDGDHAFPAAAPAAIVKFFREHALPETTTTK